MMSQISYTLEDTNKYFGIQEKIVDLLNGQNKDLSYMSMQKNFSILVSEK